MKLEGKLTDLWVVSDERIKEPAFKDVLKKRNKNIQIYDFWKQKLPESGEDDET